MADAEAPRGHSTVCGSLRRPTAQMYLRRCTGWTTNYDIRERHARAESRAQRLQYGLLGSETASEALDPIRPIPNLVELRLYEAAWDEWIARILDPPLQCSDNDQIDAVSNDVHVWSSFLSWALEPATRVRKRMRSRRFQQPAGTALNSIIKTRARISDDQNAGYILEGRDLKCVDNLKQ